MQIHQIKRKTQRKRSIKVGRGGKRGKTSGRGTKGQKARSGRKLRPEMRDIIKRLPKLRGYQFNSFQKRPFVINIGEIDKNFADGSTIDLEALIDKGLAPSRAKKTGVKILADGDFSKKVVFSGFVFSEKAKEKIEHAGGKINKK